MTDQGGEWGNISIHAPREGGDGMTLRTACRM